MAHDRDFAPAACRVLRVAQSIAGGPEQLARHLSIDLRVLEDWLTSSTPPPRQIFDRALELILDHYEVKDKRH
jgi:hypothetical protein